MSQETEEKGKISDSIREGLMVIYLLIGLNFFIGKMKDFSCEATSWMETNLVLRHIFNLAAVFFVIVLFTRNNAVFHPLILVGISFVMYFFFLLIVRCDYRFLALFIVLLAAIFYIEASRAYYKKRAKTEPTHYGLLKKLTLAQEVLNYVSLGVVFVGCIVYIGQHSREYEETWSWFIFWLGVVECKKNIVVRVPLWIDISDGIRRIFNIPRISGRPRLTT